mmetsp:Transcript_99596/g.287514  ORF Transcript_99596/g.287514 Transcript_99596/m.287514 type:complete len:207 (+) Transcript_99596:1375-1995(+)
MPRRHVYLAARAAGAGRLRGDRAGRWRGAGGCRGHAGAGARAAGRARDALRPGRRPPRAPRAGGRRPRAALGGAPHGPRRGVGRRHAAHGGAWRKLGAPRRAGGRGPKPGVLRAAGHHGLRLAAGERQLLGHGRTREEDPRAPVEALLALRLRGRGVRGPHEGARRRPGGHRHALRDGPRGARRHRALEGRARRGPGAACEVPAER